jgi:hypothetical protein
MKTALMIPGKYQEMKKDGSPKMNKTSMNVKASFCPFCGKSTS